MAGASAGLLFLASKAQEAARVMPRDAASREALQRIGERRERLGPVDSVDAQAVTRSATRTTSSTAADGTPKSTAISSTLSPD